MRAAKLLVEFLTKEDGPGEVEVVEDGVPPHGVERAVGERQRLAVGDDRGAGDAVGPQPRAGLGDGPGGQVERGHVGPGPGEHDRRHAVPAAVVEGALAAQVAEPRERRPHPRLVVEEGVGGEPQLRPGRGACRGLAVVERLLGEATVEGGGHRTTRARDRRELYPQRPPPRQPEHSRAVD
jgi:hypothetical protein